MGIGIAIIIFTIFLFATSFCIGLVAAIITYFVAKKENRRKKAMWAMMIPFAGIFSFFLLSLFSTVFIAEIKDVDMGMGDCWYVPLHNNTKLTFIDMPDQAFLEEEKVIIVDNIDSIGQNTNKIYISTPEKSYFQYNTSTKKLKQFKEESEFRNEISNLKMNTAYHFYQERRSQIMGNTEIIMVVLSAIVSLALTALLIKKAWK